jgi:hypothetical protein
VLLGPAPVVRLVCPLAHSVRSKGRTAHRARRRTVQVPRSRIWTSRRWLVDRCQRSLSERGHAVRTGPKARSSNGTRRDHTGTRPGRPQTGSAPPTRSASMTNPLMSKTPTTRASTDTRTAARPRRLDPVRPSPDDGRTGVEDLVDNLAAAVAGAVGSRSREALAHG